MRLINFYTKALSLDSSFLACFCSAAGSSSSSSPSSSSSTKKRPDGAFVVVADGGVLEPGAAQFCPFTFC